MSMAMKYAMKKRAKMYDGGQVPEPKPSPEPSKADETAKSMRKAFHYADGGMCKDHGLEMCEMCHGGKMMKDGGFVEKEKASGFSDDMVDRIMSHRYSKGGEVANDTPPMADGEENDFDELALKDDLEFSDTGANSGDEIGDDQEDEDRRDIVKRIMKSRGKKDKMPRPA